MPTGMDFRVYRDIGERAVWTFIQAFLAVFMIDDFSTVRPAAVAGLAAVLSVVKGFVATRVGEPTAALPDPS